MEEHPARPVGEGTGPAVGVADGQGGQHGGPPGGVGSVVARRLPGGQGVKLGDSGPQGEHRAEGEGRRGGVAGGAEDAVQGDTGAGAVAGEAGVVE